MLRFGPCVRAAAVWVNHRALAAGLCLVCLSTAVAATEQQVFRGRADLVPVRVTVTDAAGNPVSGLTAADFLVFEDDVQREVVSFAADAFVSNDARRIGSTTQAGPDSTIPPRHFLIVLGDGRVHGPARGLDGATDLIQKHLLPGDRVAVLAFNRATAFTSDRSTILSVLDRFRTAHESIVFDASEWYFRRHFTDLPAAIQRRIDAIFDGADPRGAVELLMGMAATGASSSPCGISGSPLPV